MGQFINSVENWFLIELFPNLSPYMGPAETNILSQQKYTRNKNVQGSLNDEGPGRQVLLPQAQTYTSYFSAHLVSLVSN